MRGAHCACTTQPSAWRTGVPRAAVGTAWGGRTGGPSQAIRGDTALPSLSRTAPARYDAAALGPQSSQPPRAPWASASPGRISLNQIVAAPISLNDRNVRRCWPIASTCAGVRPCWPLAAALPAGASQPSAWPPAQTQPIPIAQLFVFVTLILVVVLVAAVIGRLLALPLRLAFGLGGERG